MIIYDVVTRKSIDRKENDHLSGDHSSEWSSRPTSGFVLLSSQVLQVCVSLLLIHTLSFPPKGWDSAPRRLL